MSEQEFLPLTDREKQWIADHLESAQLFVAAMSPADAAGPVTLEALDRAWAAWLGDAAPDGDIANATINSVGIQLGQFLVDRAGFAWTIVRESRKTDLAIRALPGRGDVLVFPANFVAKRWTRREVNFLTPSFAMICQQVASIAAGRLPGGARPWWKFW